MKERCYHYGIIGHTANIRKSQTTQQVTEAGGNVTMDADSEESDGEYDL